MESLTRQLYRHIGRKAVTAADLRKTREFMLDWAGCHAAGKRTAEGRILQNWNAKWGGTGLEQEVFLAAALSHITETDDLHRASVTHPACVVFPVTWHLTRFLKKPFGDCILASLKGYEVMCRIGEAVGREHYKIFHNTATAGVFGSAAAAVYLMDLSEEQFVWALGNAGTQAAGLWQFNSDAAMSKPLHAGHAAAAGLKAALLAAEGLTGTAQILEGEKGFFKGLCADPNPDAVTADNSGWKLSETSIKPYPSCRHTHPSIDAALNVREQMNEAGVQISEIDHVEIRTYDTALRVTDNPSPDSTYSAKFSIQYCVSLALRKGFPGLNHFEGEELDKNRTSDLLTKIKTREDQKYSSAYPMHWGSHLNVYAGGQNFESEIESAKGDPENPLTSDELLEKFHGLMEYAEIEKEQANSIAGWILDSDDRERIPDNPFNEKMKLKTS